MSERVVARRVGLRARALRGSIVVVGGQLATQAVRMLSNLVLSHLLGPQAFGLIAIVRLVLEGLQKFSDVGIRASIIRHERGDDVEFLNTAWTLQVIRGFTLWAIGAAAAWPLAVYVEDSRMTPLILVGTMSAILSGFSSTKLISQRRNLQMERVVGIDLVAHVLSLLAMVGYAMVSPTVWALILGAVVTRVVQSLSSHVVLPGPPNRFRWEPTAAREIVTFGRWILLSTLLTFVASRVDVFILPRLVSLEVLGVYSISLLIGGVPLRLTEPIIQSVLLPTLSAAHRQGRAQLEAGERRVRRVLLPAGLLLLMILMVATPPFVAYGYDVRYAEASWMVQLAIPALWLSFLQDTAGRTLVTVGDSRAFSLSNGARSIGTVAGTVLGFVVAGLPGLILGRAVGPLLGYAVTLVGLRAHELPIGRDDARYTALGLALAVVGGVGPYVLARETGLDVPLLTLLLAPVTLGPLTVVALRRLWAER